MAFCLSRCIGLVTPEPHDAARLYESCLGMEVDSVGAGFELTAGDMRVFIDPGDPRPLVFELLTDEFDSANATLRSFGFETIVWKGQGQSCLVRDPFGQVFNVYADQEAFLPDSMEMSRFSFVKACIGCDAADPEACAAYYARVLASPASKFPDGSWAVDSGRMRLRFKAGDSSGPLLWLSGEVAPARLMAAGMTEECAGEFVDPFGVRWVIDTANKVSHAAVRI